MNYEEKEKKFYNHLWRSLNGKFDKEKSSYRSDNPSEQVKDFLKSIPIKSGRLLDIGCGNGRNALYASKQGFEVTGIDISDEAINFAKKRAESENVVFENESIFSCKYGKFDVIIDMGCLHHQRKSQWKHYFKKIKQLLNPGGYYLLFAFSDNTKYVHGIKSRPENRTWSLRQGHYSYFFSKNTILDLTKDFQIVKDYEWHKPNSPKKFWVFYLKYIK